MIDDSSSYKANKITNIYIYKKNLIPYLACFLKYQQSI